MLLRPALKKYKWKNKEMEYAMERTRDQRRLTRKTSSRNTKKRPEDQRKKEQTRKKEQKGKKIAKNC